MESARLQWRRTTTPATLLGLTLLIPGAFALQCHSYSSISESPIGNAFAVHKALSTCSSSQNACVEAHLLLTTGETTVFASHRGCAGEGLKDEGNSSAGDQHLAIQSYVRYCHTDFCNKEVNLNAFKTPKQDNERSSSQCFSGFAIHPSQDILGRMTCGKNSSQCYEGKGTITVGLSKVGFLIKTCQDSSCNVPESQSFGPIELKLRGSCCHGTFCNGQAVAPQILASNSTATTQTATRPHEEENITHPTDFPKHDIVNSTQEDYFEGPVDVPFKDDSESDINIPTSDQNPWYDEEEKEDERLLPVHTNNTLNPRAANLGPPNPSLSFYLLLAALGVGSLRI